MYDQWTGYVIVAAAAVWLLAGMIAAARGAE